MSGRVEVSQDFGDILKHEARLKLWLPVLRELKNSSERYLKYFTLPGPRAYDVIRWQIDGLIQNDGKGFPEVCFCEIDQDNYAKAKLILGNTRGIKASFEDIIRKGPGDQRYKAFWDLFPFDVYNLDFCGTWFEGDEPLSKTFTSIIKLINYHISIRTSGNFLLFLTIRIDSRRTNSQVIRDLKHNLETNRKITWFSERINSLVGSDINKFITKFFHRFILVSIPKLISSRLIPQTKKFYGKVIDIKRGYYPRDGYYIGKFVFLIEKDRTTLKTNPPWYTKCVNESLDLTNVLEITKDNVSEDTIEDLNKLKEEIKRIENYA